MIIFYSYFYSLIMCFIIMNLYFHHYKSFLFFQVFCCFLKLIFSRGQQFNIEIQVLVILIRISSNLIYETNALFYHLNAHSLRNWISHPHLLLNFLNCSYLFFNEFLTKAIDHPILLINFELEVKAVFQKSFILEFQELHLKCMVTQAIFINSNGIFIFQYQNFILGNLWSLSA